MDSVMSFIADLALIISAGGMIALAILTRRSVGVMQESLKTMQKDSLLKIRPFIRVDDKVFALTVAEDWIWLRYRIVNVGISPAFIETFDISLNNEMSVGAGDDIITELPVMAFPREEDLYYRFCFRWTGLLKEHRAFRLDIKMEYYSVGFEEIKYCFTGVYDLYCKEIESGGIEVERRIVRSEKTT